jgi:hypothetical protein
VELAGSGVLIGVDSLLLGCIQILGKGGAATYPERKHKKSQKKKKEKTFHLEPPLKF